MDKELNYFQINLHKAYAPTFELNNLLRSISTFIVLIQEPVSRLGKIIGINNKIGNIVHVGGTGKPRAALFFSKNLNFHPLYQFCSQDLAVASLMCKINGVDKVIVICSGYFPYEVNDMPPSSEFVTVVEYCKANNLPLISGIDSNRQSLRVHSSY